LDYGKANFIKNVENFQDLEVSYLEGPEWGYDDFEFPKENFSLLTCKKKRCKYENLLHFSREQQDLL